MTTANLGLELGALTLSQLLEKEGKLVFVVLLGEDGEIQGEAEPYLVFGPQHRLYGLEAIPDLGEYTRKWLAFEEDPNI